MPSRYPTSNGIISPEIMLYRKGSNSATRTLDAELLHPALFASVLDRLKAITPPGKPFTFMWKDPGRSFRQEGSAIIARTFHHPVDLKPFLRISQYGAEDDSVGLIMTHGFRDKKPVIDIETIDRNPGRPAIASMALLPAQ